MVVQPKITDFRKRVVVNTNISAVKEDIENIEKKEEFFNKKEQFINSQNKKNRVGDKNE